MELITKNYYDSNKQTVITYKTDKFSSKTEGLYLAYLISNLNGYNDVKISIREYGDVGDTHEFFLNQVDDFLKFVYRFGNLNLNICNIEGKLNDSDVYFAIRFKDYKIRVSYFNNNMNIDDVMRDLEAQMSELD